MGEINLDSGFPSFVLIHLFKDAMAKFGKSGKLIDQMDYNVVDGLTVVDDKGVNWKIEVNAKVIIPESLKTNRVSDEEAKQFCVECTWGIRDNESLCDVCKYLDKI